ncbi:hypothetical protein [Bradyrhizobium sp. CCBAU 51627]|uniref:hypothetical protein n=1 Tax=Bradyrhizobium sp. CCBAU 51627 TaxID=1325088 RepID=UPI0023066022|nr:hypothetical protein [Bradyrhizobium sp. CCBAU 51627]MDA9433566.1 hypothetical protein [Bradyrhizobium sp. CCBAU 51627]
MSHMARTAAVLLLSQVATAPIQAAQTATPSVKIGTLAPEGTNHDLNVKRWIAYRKVANPEIVYYDSFLIAGDDLANGKINYVIVTPAHPQQKEMAKQGENKIFLEECFKGATYEMGLLTRETVQTPRSVAFMPVTAKVFDGMSYEVKISVRSNVDAGRKLVAGEVDSAVTFTSFASENPGKFKILKLIPIHDVTWQVYSTKKPTTSDIGCELSLK